MIGKKKLFKWVGGKKWIKQPLVKIVQEQCDNSDHGIDTYVEPCVGGLGSFLSVAETLVSRGVQNVYLNDVNEVLINTFQDLQKRNNSLFDEYILIEKQYEAKIPREYRIILKSMKKEDVKENLKAGNAFFREKREEYNSIKGKHTIRRSALFIFLMQHVFNGVYRENKSGGLNSPYNWDSNIASRNIMRSLFLEYKHLFENFNLKFSSKDIFNFLDGIDIDWKKTICYIDPPFMNEKNNEMKYSKDQFKKEDQKNLLIKVDEKKIVNLIYSNHDFKIFTEFAEKHELKMKRYYRTNKINPLNASKITELLIFKSYLNE